MKTGTLFCKLFGHKFIGGSIQYHPHYLDGVKCGAVAILTDNDYIYVEGPRNYCVRCGIRREDLIVIKDHGPR